VEYYLIAGPTKKGEFFVSRVSGMYGKGRMVTKTSMTDATHAAEGMRKRDKQPKRPIKRLNTEVLVKGLDY